MKKGVEYSHSRQKERLDKAVAYAISPAGHLSRVLLAWQLRDQTGEDRDARFWHRRFGQDGEPIDVSKLRTLRTGTKESLGKMALLYRNSGIDELQQAHNILRGQMSAVGHRPIQAHEQEAVFDNAGSGKLVDYWKKIVKPTRPGLASSFSILNHHEEEKIEMMIERAPVKLELDIKDVMDGSLVYDLSIMRLAFGSLIVGRNPKIATTPRTLRDARALLDPQSPIIYPSVSDSEQGFLLDPSSLVKGLVLGGGGFVEPGERH